MNERLIYTVQEVAKMLHSSPNYIYTLIEKGYLPALKLGSLKILRSSNHLLLFYLLPLFVNF